MNCLQVFEDAMENFNEQSENQINQLGEFYFLFSFGMFTLRHSSGELTLNLTEVLLECQEITHLFLTNHLNESLRRTKAQ